MTLNDYNTKMTEIYNSMMESFESNEDNITESGEWWFTITKEQRIAIESSIDMFEEWFNNSFEYEEFVYDDIEFDDYSATVKFYLSR